MRTRVVLAGLLAALGLAAAGAAAAGAALPQIDYTLSGPAGRGDWFTGPVTLKWSLSGETDSTGCDSRTVVADTPGVQVTCTASNASGAISATTRPIRVDQTAPAGVTVAPARPADAGGWYTAPVALTWTGTDATSGLASCTTLTFTGPDDPVAAPSGTCRDRAGNESAAVTYGLAFDATPPSLASVSAAPASSGDAATVRWVAGRDAVHVQVVRAPGDARAASRTVYDGAATRSEIVDRGLAGGAAYAWTVTVRDAAGNAATARALATPPRVLDWRAVSGARYYNVQIRRRGHKILSLWPSASRLRVPATWRFHGRRLSLAPGTYEYLVWPGFGLRARHRYGRLCARGRFSIPAPPAAR